MTASSYTGGLHFVQVSGAGSVGGNVDANGVDSAETAQRHISFKKAFIKEYKWESELIV